MKIDGANISEVTALTVTQALDWFGGLEALPPPAEIARRMLKEITERLGFLLEVGLDYLTLDRPTATLAGGEAQRIRLATQIGSKLSGVLYILDEPSIGLHPRDTQKLLPPSRMLRDLGNTVIVVEHDPDTIRPGRLRRGHGPGGRPGRGPGGLWRHPGGTGAPRSQSLTGLYLSGKREITAPGPAPTGQGLAQPHRGHGATTSKTWSVAIPLGVLTCITGVSGSGKSTLIMDTLYLALRQKLYRAKHRRRRRMTRFWRARVPGQGDQHRPEPHRPHPPLQPRHLLRAVHHVRELFSQVPEARLRGYKPGRFSFNVKGGRCEACRGEGINKIEMHFLPDVYVRCEVCRGLRYNPSSLEIRYKGNTIAEVLDHDRGPGPGVLRAGAGPRDPLADPGGRGPGLRAAGAVGHHPVRRRGPAPEALPGTEQTGHRPHPLHPGRAHHRACTWRTSTSFSRCSTAWWTTGNTVIVIEHNLEVIKTADYLIDLGPEGGDGGGILVAAGTPEEVAQQKGSHTGWFLRELLH